MVARRRFNVPSSRSIPLGRVISRATVASGGQRVAIRGHGTLTAFLESRDPARTPVADQRYEPRLRVTPTRGKRDRRTTIGPRSPTNEHRFFLRANATTQSPVQPQRNTERERASNSTRVLGLPGTRFRDVRSITSFMNIRCFNVTNLNYR